MRGFWLFINALLLALFLAAAGMLIWVLKGFMPSTVQATTGMVAEAAPQAGPVDLPGAIKFRMKSNASVQEEAILVEPEEPFRFTLRPVLDPPDSTPTSVRAHIDTHANLEDRVELEWKSEGGGKVNPAGEGRYEFTPPEEGGDVHLSFRGHLRLSATGGLTANLSGETHLKLLCPVSWEKLPSKNQELIGKYPSVGPKSGLPRDFYKRPTHFYRVTSENENWRISPHFKLGDFDLHFDYTSRESPEINQFPQYIALNPNLVAKLESIIEGLSETGIHVNTLGILAGFRSPAYNHWKKQQGGVGGKYTKGLSTHMYGAAADFYVDQDGDGVMDDLNGDGKVDQNDAAWVRDQVVDAIDCQAQDSKSGLAGACGTYDQHDVPDREPQTPNLHVDTRGYHVGRWYINARDEMVTDWSHWQKNPCPNAQPAEILEGDSNHAESAE